MSQLTQSLDLTDDEQIKIKPVVDQTAAEFHNKLQEHQPVTRDQIESAIVKIRAFLTPDHKGSWTRFRFRTSSRPTSGPNCEVSKGCPVIVGDEKLVV